MIKSSALAKWTARVVGGLLVVLYGSFIVGQITDGSFEGAWLALTMFCSLLLVSIIAYGFAWSKPARGGVWVIVGGMSMAFFHLTRGDWASAIVYGIPFIFCGVLFMLSAPHVSTSDMPSTTGLDWPTRTNRLSLRIKKEES